MVNNENQGTKVSRQAVEKALLDACLVITTRQEKDYETTKVKIKLSELSFPNSIPDRLYRDITYRAEQHQTPIDVPNFSWSSDECGFVPSRDAELENSFS